MHTSLLKINFKNKNKLFKQILNYGSFYMYSRLNSI